MSRHGLRITVRKSWASTTPFTLSHHDSVNRPSTYLYLIITAWSSSLVTYDYTRIFVHDPQESKITKRIMWTHRHIGCPLVHNRHNTRADSHESPQFRPYISSVSLGAFGGPGQGKEDIEKKGKEKRREELSRTFSLSCIRTPWTLGWEKKAMKRYGVWDATLTHARPAGGLWTTMYE